MGKVDRSKHQIEIGNDRGKHQKTVEDHKKELCKKFNIDHKLAQIAASMHDEGHVYQGRDEK